MKIKNLYISKFFIKCLFLIVLFFVVGCSNKSEEIYNSAIQKGLDNLASENYDKAIVSFEIALEEKAGDKQAKDLKSQTEYFDIALKSFEAGNLEKTSENVERVKIIKHGSEALVKKSNDIIEEIKVITTTKKSFQNQYNDADMLFKDNDYSGSLEKIKTLLQEDLIDETYYVTIKESSQELEKSIKNEIDEQTLANTTEIEKQTNIDEENPTNSIEAYNNLDQSLKVILATTTVDERAMSPNLDGYNLYYNFDEDYLIANVHSGVGSGHPWFIIKYDESTITPVEGVVYMGGGTEYDDVTLESISTSKSDLYNRYIESKDSYDLAVEKVVESPDMTMSAYNELRTYINQ
ncbi:MAG: hypothetical protein KC455_10100 [Carnobacterium sp.]|nr:hypothetical protein [Carnobacterium sp.]